MSKQTVLVPTDIVDPYTGEPLYVSYTIRPIWYLRLRQLKLWLDLVLLRMHPWTAFEVAFRCCNEDIRWTKERKQRIKQGKDADNGPKD